MPNLGCIYINAIPIGVLQAYFYNYAQPRLHQLKDTDHAAFASFLHDRDVEILDRRFFTDEEWFHLSGYVNNQNSRVWTT